MRRISFVLLTVQLVFAAFWAQGCASGTGSPSVMTVFDSRWGEGKRVQQRNAAVATPATIHSAGVDGAESRGPARVFRVRVYATAAYATQTMDWRRKVQDIVDDANPVLERNLRIRLQIESYRDWATPQEEDLGNTLLSLRSRDPGTDVDWVMGMVGALSRTTASFHQVGMGDLKGKYLVVRAAGNLEEHKAIERGFDELKEEDRAQLVRARKRHRAVAVFLHEIGHTLDAPHVRDPRSFMAPDYDSHMEAYDEGSIARMRSTIAHRDESPASPSAEASSAGAGARAPAPAPASTEKALPADVAALSEADRTRYASALRAHDEGDSARAYETGHTLFESRRTVYSVQDLRCKVALGRGLVWTETRTECDDLMKLSGAKK